MCIVFVYVVYPYVNVYVYVLVYVYPLHELIHSLIGICVFVLHGCCFLVLTTFRCSFFPFNESAVVEMAPLHRSTHS